MPENNNDRLDSRGNPRVQTSGFEETLTVQTDAHKADINKLLKKYKAVGIMDHLKDVDAQFLDISEHTDYADAMRHVREAEATFMTLPSKVREVFNHSVEEWLDAAHSLPGEQNALLAKTGLDLTPAADTDSGAANDPPTEAPAE